ncbi:hypothetical protein F2Q70_00041001 [Brassica cretica]|uniref:Fatty acyl-CoA reductase n=1 Tax=Brassica cretica TaxID=69181 RepID=A0A8S9K371_BRACR|nr:hypothetical protein F2Q70_00041001 [Brassica cretica]
MDSSTFLAATSLDQGKPFPVSRQPSKQKKKTASANKAIKVRYISNPMKVKTCASKFRELVQELTGQDAVDQPEPVFSPSTVSDLSPSPPPPENLAPRVLDPEPFDDRVCEYFEPLDGEEMFLPQMSAATINAVSFFSGKPDHFLARPLSQTTPRIQTSCCHREPSFKPWTPIMMSEVETYTKSDSHGVGIFRFLQGKSYLITGATGFLAKVLILKLVRESPEIGNIFILMKTQDQESANKRLYDEIISSDLFRLIKQTHGSSYEAFMKSKLIPVVGDIGEDNLGIKSRMAYNISDEIDVIISCAGRTTFDYRSLGLVILVKSSM